MLQLVFSFLNQLYEFSHSCVTTNKICSEVSECFPWEDANGAAEMSSSERCELCKSLKPYYLAELLL